MIMTDELMHTTLKQWHCAAHVDQIYQFWSEKKTLHSNLLYSSMNQWLFEKSLCSQTFYYENYRQFLLQMEAIMSLPQNWHFFAVNKYEEGHL